MRKILAAVAAASLATAAQAVVFVNGSFEQGVDPGSFVTLSGGDSTSITGWTVQPLGVDYIGSYWAASDGSRSLDMSSTDRGQITQMTSGYIIGRRYVIGFDMSANPSGALGLKHMTVSATSGDPFTYMYDLTAANSVTNMLWQHFTYSFIAGSTMQQVQFLSQEQNPFGPALDNVTISEVPEPATWAMLFLGFGLVGFAARRRRMARIFAA